MNRQTVHRQLWWSSDDRQSQQILEREWLLTNGLGGYASGTICGTPTCSYHGFLIASLPAPLGRTMMLNRLTEEIAIANGTAVTISGHHPIQQTPATTEVVLISFALEFGLPVWTYRLGEYLLERRAFMPYRGNTIHLIYRLVGGTGAVRLRLRPAFHFRPHDASLAEPLTRPYRLIADGPHFEVHSTEAPPLRMSVQGNPASLVLDGGRFLQVNYPAEGRRGYDDRGTLWSPGYFAAELNPGQEVSITASSESWESLLAAQPRDALASELERRERLIDQADPRARTGFAAELLLAADQFIITPETRVADAARAHSAGDEIRSVIAGYHWFTDWGRDTMISLEGLTLVTGRYAQAGYILRTFAQYVADGLIPNLFPEGERTGLYHTADATLWYFHALHRYLKYTNDRATLRLLLPTLQDIVRHHLQGTRFGIGVDAADGLLRQGAPGYQLTWMDAKVDDWVVTPRRGKAVEINALWYNSLRLMADWLADEGQPEEARLMFKHADRARESFNARFWCGKKGWLYDVVDGEGPDDSALRPNQLFAISLQHPVLDDSRWAAVVDVATERLLTPMGLRSLAPGEPGYQPRYDGDLRARDAAYHQGTVWAWLIGAYLDARLKTYPNRQAETSDFLAGFSAHLNEDCVGSVSEIFDAEAPYTPRGCIAQAWSVAEVLRCLVTCTG